MTDSTDAAADRTDTATDRTLSDLLGGLDIAMVATADDTGTWRARPLSLAGQQGDVLSFLVSVEADWVEALEDSGSPTTVTFADPSKNTYVAVQGSARTVEDRTRIADLWNVGAGAYFEGPEDPTVRVLDVEVAYGEYWDGPHGRVGALLQLAARALGKETGTQGDVVT